MRGEGGIASLTHTCWLTEVLVRCLVRHAVHYYVLKLDALLDVRVIHIVMKYTFSSHFEDNERISSTEAVCLL